MIVRTGHKSDRKSFFWVLFWAGGFLRANDSVGTLRKRGRHDKTRTEIETVRDLGKIWVSGFFGVFSFFFPISHMHMHMHMHMCTL